MRECVSELREYVSTCEQVEKVSRAAASGAARFFDTFPPDPTLRDGVRWEENDPYVCKIAVLTYFTTYFAY